MRKMMLLVLVFALAACSAPAPATAPTGTSTPPPTLTATVTFTATPVPTPTEIATPDPFAALPEEVRGLAQQGYTMNEAGNMMVDPVDGSVGGVIGRDGTWVVNGTEIPNQIGAKITFENDSWKVTFADGVTIEFRSFESVPAAIQSVLSEVNWGGTSDFAAAGYTPRDFLVTDSQHFNALTETPEGFTGQVPFVLSDDSGRMVLFKVKNVDKEEIPFDGVMLSYRSYQGGVLGDMQRILIPGVTKEGVVTYQYYVEGGEVKVR